MTGRKHLPHANNRVGRNDRPRQGGERPRNCEMKMMIKEGERAAKDRVGQNDRLG